MSETSTVLITGATDGLGRAAALRLAAEGYRVVAAGRNAERRVKLDAEAAARRLPISTVEMDVCDDASVRHALAEVRATAGPVDVLINNAGIGVYAVVEELGLDGFRKLLETNLFGALRVTLGVLPEMRARRRGRIVNLSSIAGKLTIPLFGAYSASKYALEAMSDALRLELHPFGIHVALIEPGYIPTGFQNVAWELSGRYRAGAANSPYAAVYKNYGRAREKSVAQVRDTPENCAEVILRAVRDTPPRPRYTVTRQAWLGALAKRLLPDRWLDRRLRCSFGLDRAAQETATTDEHR